jgi:hypothetical protein
LIRRRELLRSPHFLSIPVVIASTDLVVAVPEPVGKVFSKIVNLQVLKRAPALPAALLAAAIRRAGQLLRVLTEHLLDRAEAGRQAEPLERPIHILPSHLEARHERERWGRVSADHGVALLCRFDTRSLAAQGGQRLPP